MTINKTMKFAIMFMAAITLMIITAFFPVKKIILYTTIS